MPCLNEQPLLQESLFCQEMLSNPQSAVNANDFTDNQIDLVRAPNKRPRTFDQTSPSHTTPSKQEREIISSAQKHVFATTDATDDESCVCV